MGADLSTNYHKTNMPISKKSPIANENNTTSKRRGFKMPSFLDKKGGKVEKEEKMFEDRKLKPSTSKSRFGFTSKSDRKSVV